MIYVESIQILGTIEDAYFDAGLKRKENNRCGKMAKECEVPNEEGLPFNSTHLLKRIKIREEVYSTPSPPTIYTHHPAS